MDIEDIIKEDDLPIKSSKLMERIRRECIFLRNDYFRSFFTSDTVTIDPKSDCVKFKLDQHDLVEDYVKIYANSFGPFNPEKYFEKDTFRILWLLKESYMQSGDLDKYKNGEYRYLGGHDQAEEFNYFKDLESDTHVNLVKISQDILKEFQLITEEELNILGNHPIKNQILKLKKEKLDDENNVMSHICILEANHFPGLAFNSTDSDDTKINIWMSGNENYLSKMIQFYNPDLAILGGKKAMYSIIHCIYRDKEDKDEDFFNWTRVSKIQDYGESKYSLFDRKLLPDSDNQKVLDLEGKNEGTQRAAIFQDEKGTVWFPWYHPSPRSFNIYWNSKWKSEDKNALEEIIKFIKKYVLSKNSD